MVAPAVQRSEACEIGQSDVDHKPVAKESVIDVTWKEIRIHDVPASLASVTQGYQVLCTRCARPTIEKTLLQYGASFKCSNQSCTNRHQRAAVAFPGDDQQGVDPAKNPLCHCNVVSRFKRIYVDETDLKKGSEKVFECAALRCDFGEEHEQRPSVKFR
ncbi:hypothetical protein CB0940_05043 [Cercospora beticola]|uniref:Uncharacterized protein n=1 Tax=Cercospora beticola TaxID=122368 RepID=A0A2G5HL55_CERBT|nr:hypothetical protein CB0940_05043 [Cercospora beticola]PIA93258.1 hypothetical protein CB0940_05043 [Cercospora beticola]WPB02334.1 hypothetical protein RHO25_006968 [Cercospora beticola]